MTAATSVGARGCRSLGGRAADPDALAAQRVGEDARRRTATGPRPGRSPDDGRPPSTHSAVMGATTWSGRYDGSHVRARRRAGEERVVVADRDAAHAALAEALGGEVGQAGDVGARRVRRRLTGTVGRLARYGSPPPTSDEPPAGEHGARGEGVVRAERGERGGRGEQLGGARRHERPGVALGDAGVAASPDHRRRARRRAARGRRRRAPGATRAAYRPGRGDGRRRRSRRPPGPVPRARGA